MGAAGRVLALLALSGASLAQVTEGLGFRDPFALLLKVSEWVLEATVGGVWGPDLALGLRCRVWFSVRNLVVALFFQFFKGHEALVSVLM